MEMIVILTEVLKSELIAGMMVETPKLMDSADSQHSDSISREVCELERWSILNVAISSRP